MVGSSQPLGFVNTIINALVTISFRDFARELEVAEDPLAKAYEIVGRVYQEHKRILFHGNGYTQEWVEEAARRGLPNLDSTIKAIPTIITPENLAFLKKSKALSEAEAYARYEIMFNQYIQKINIELRVANDMVRQEILPAAIAYCQQLAQGNFYCEQAGTLSGIAVKFQREIAMLTDEISDLCYEMHFARNSTMKLPKMEEKAEKLYIIHRDKLSALRAKVDRLESMMPKDKWPMPSYTDLLFDL